MTSEFFEVCLAFGFWPSFFHNTNYAGPHYFDNKTLFERDRPVFKKFVPILHAINQAGWHPMRHASLSVGRTDGAPATVFIERFGDAAPGMGLYWTLRNDGAFPCQNLTLRVDVHGLGLVGRSWSVREVSMTLEGVMLLKMDNGSRYASLQLPPLPARKTLVLHLVDRTMDKTDNISVGTNQITFQIPDSSQATL
jgi:hypothetical protein